MKRVRIFLLICSFLCYYPLIAPTMAQSSSDMFTVGGLVKDKKTNRILEYVNVSMLGTNIGTITNADGTFLLKVKRSGHSRVLVISSLGYISARYTIEENNTGNQVFYLEPNAVKLKEVEVVNIDPREVVQRAIKNIRENYNAQPSLNTGFYRETVQKGKRFISISEAVTDVNKSPYTEDISKDKVKVLKGRKLLSPKTDDTLAVKLVGGPTLSIYLDLVKNTDILMNQDALPLYLFSFHDYVNIDGRLHYMIAFKPTVKIEEPLYEGTLFIDRETFTLSRAEFELDMSNKDKVTNIILKKRPFGLRFTPTRVSYLVTYKRDEGVSSLNYIRSEIRFKCDWKRKLFATNYTVMSEFVVTNRVDKPLEKISNRESFHPDDVLSDKISSFLDEKFWYDYNIIEPTESLEKAVNKLKKEYK